MFEVEGVDRELAELAFTNASHKLPVKTKLWNGETFNERSELNECPIRIGC
jgi:ribosomal protein L16/L10AE